MSKKIKNFFKHHIILIWIVLVCIALSFMIAMAAYPTKQNKAKKVVSLQSQPEIQFSSNYLEELVLYKTIVIDDDDPITVDIRNFSKNNSTKWYLSDISFTLSAELTNSSGTLITNDSLIGDGEVIVTAVLIDDEKNESETELFRLSSDEPDNSIAQKLEYNSLKATVQSYKIYFPSADSKVCLKLTAVPDNTHTDLKTISAILAVSDKSSIQSDGWTGSFNDPTTKSPAEYDAFNYAIVGHGDSNSATIKWDSSVVTLNKMYFSNTFSSDITSANDLGDSWKQITISISDDSNNGQYAFQVFKAGSGFDTFINSTSDAWENEHEGKTKEQFFWDELQKCIVFDDGM